MPTYASLPVNGPPWVLHGIPVEHQTSNRESHSDWLAGLEVWISSERADVSFDNLFYGHLAAIYRDLGVDSEALIRPVAENSYLVMVYDGKQWLGGIRLSLRQSQQLECERGFRGAQEFSQELEVLTNAGQQVAEVTSFWVLPQYRKCSLGFHLIVAVSALAQFLGVSRIYSIANHKILRLVQTAGFQVHTRHQGLKYPSENHSSSIIVSSRQTRAQRGVDHSPLFERTLKLMSKARRFDEVDSYHQSKSSRPNMLHETNVSKPIQRIVIVGGGTAGWISAHYVKAALKDDVEVSLVESPDVGRIGVGEATVPTIRRTFNFIGLDESDWVSKCHGTIKLGVRFRRWCTGGEDDEFFHPFFAQGNNWTPSGTWFPIIGDGIQDHDVWKCAYKHGRGTAFGAWVNPLWELAKQNAVPFDKQSMKPLGIGQSAYHFDAHALADLLRDRAGLMGINHIIGHVESVRRIEQGDIAGLQLRGGGELTGDFFIDCTGMASVLLQKTLGVPFQNAGETLFMNRAVALPVGYGEDERAWPYTTATAMRDGWVWETPLQHRIGTGYVYSDVSTTPEEAERTLRKFHEGRPQGEAKHIRMRIGRLEQAWSHNAVAIGMSNGFLEPLESTTIFLIEYALARLVNQWSSRNQSMAYCRDIFNYQMAKMFDEIRDFICLHYILSQRNDSAFWRRVASETVVPKSLENTLAAYRAGFISADGYTLNLFERRSHACVLSGLRADVGDVPAMVAARSDEAIAEYDRRVAINRAAIANCASHQSWIQSCGG